MTEKLGIITRKCRIRLLQEIEVRSQDNACLIKDRLFFLVTFLPLACEIHLQIVGYFANVLPNWMPILPRP